MQWSRSTVPLCFGESVCSGALSLCVGGPERPRSHQPRSHQLRSMTTTYSRALSARHWRRFTAADAAFLPTLA